MTNDRFKFRVWSKIGKVYFGEDYGVVYYSSKSKIDDDLYRVQCNGPFELSKNDDFIIEQCTGLKDKNGKLIYEGDIMGHRIYLGNPELYVVKWSESVNGWVYQEAKNSLKTSYILTEFTDSIIGNIHENPELLKESK